jgi:uncharacterized protein
LLLANEKGNRMAKVPNSRIAAIFLISLLFLCGCSTSKPPNYFILHSLQSEAPGAENDLTIGVGPIKIPEYLDRPQMATRSTPNSLQFAEFDKWAESLEKDLTRVLAENLSILLSTDRVAVFPWPGSMHVTHQVTVDLAKLDYTPDGKILLIAGWSVFGDEGKKLLTMKRSRLTVPVQSTGFEAIAAAQSRAVEDMSREIAAAIRSLPGEAAE